MVTNQSQTHPESERDVELHSSLEESLIDKQRSIHAASRDLSRAIREQHRHFRQNIRSLIDPQILGSSLQRYREIKKQFADIPNRFQQNPSGQNEATTYRKKLARQVHEFYHGLGIDAQNARSLRQQRLNAIKSVLQGYIKSDDETPQRPAQEAPTSTSNPWQTRIPPYDGRWEWHSGDGSLPGWSVDARAWAETGLVELSSDIFNAPWTLDEDEWVKMESMAEVGHWYRMPAAGKVEAWVVLRQKKTQYGGGLQDQSGCSDGYAQQLSRAYLWILAPEIGWGTTQYSTIHHIERNTDEDTYWSDTHPANIENKYIVSKEAYGANAFIYVAAGVHDLHSFTVNDMSFFGSMNSQWIVDRVWLKSTGAA